MPVCLPACLSTRPPPTRLHACRHSQLTTDDAQRRQSRVAAAGVATTAAVLLAPAVAFVGPVGHQRHVLAREDALIGRRLLFRAASKHEQTHKHKHHKTQTQHTAPREQQARQQTNDESKRRRKGGEEADLANARGCSHHTADSCGGAGCRHSSPTGDRWRQLRRSSTANLQALTPLQTLPPVKSGSAVVCCCCRCDATHAAT